MDFKLLVALVEHDKTTKVLKGARQAGATGATVIHQARGEGLKEARSFLGLALESPRDVLLFVVATHLSRTILEKIAELGEFDIQQGAGIAIQLNVEDAVGVTQQVRLLGDSLGDAP
ncbi:MAG TPA: P-II family nitrogen regulator [Nevskiaceae bacterium]